MHAFKPSSSAPARPAVTDVDVVVVGAGVSGLNAAARLTNDYGYSTRAWIPSRARGWSPSPCSPVCGVPTIYGGSAPAKSLHPRPRFLPLPQWSLRRATSLEGASLGHGRRRGPPAWGRIPPRCAPSRVCAPRWFPRTHQRTVVVRADCPTASIQPAASFLRPPPARPLLPLAAARARPVLPSRIRRSVSPPSRARAPPPTARRRRVRQDKTFLPGCELEMGAEFVHGDLNEPTQLAEVRRGRRVTYTGGSPRSGACAATPPRPAPPFHPTRR